MCVSEAKNRQPEVSIIFPCRNEEASIGVCIEQAKKLLKERNVRGEIIVSDSSTDSSPDIAQRYEVLLVNHNKDGYGNAYHEALPYATGTYVVCIDADGSYNIEDIIPVLQQLRLGNSMVLGNRFTGTMDEGAMPFLNKYVGNPVLSFLFRLFFRVPYRDIHCGLRGIRRSALMRLSLHTTGMEYASEMVREAVCNNLSIAEVPVRYHKRNGSSKLKPFSDGWRHIRYMLLFSPRYLFYVPGVVTSGLGIGGLLWFYFVEKTVVFGFVFYYHPMFIASVLLLAGVQLVAFGMFAQMYTQKHFHIRHETLERLRKYMSLERGIVAGTIMFACGVIVFAWMFYQWMHAGFPAFTNETRLAVVALTLCAVGVQIFFSSFILGLLSVPTKQ